MSWSASSRHLLRSVIMSVLGDLLVSLRSMDSWQLLLAFLACTAYAAAQGALLPAAARRFAWGAAALASVGFAFISADWTQATMLMGMAVVGFGSVSALVWTTSRALGLGSVATGSAAEETLDAPVAVGAPAPLGGGPQRSGPRPGATAHSV
jgi:hypothetical protein